MRWSGQTRFFVYPAFSFRFYDRHERHNHFLDAYSAMRHRSFSFTNEGA
jgi:hypothetical protein